MADELRVTGPRTNASALRDDVNSCNLIEVVAIAEHVRDSDPLTQTRQFELIDLVIGFGVNLAAGATVELAKAALLPILKKHGFRQAAPKSDPAAPSKLDAAN